MLFSRENIIVFGEDLKLDINLRITIVIEYFNSRFIRNLSSDFFLQGERVFHINICVLVCD